MPLPGASKNGLVAFLINACAHVCKRTSLMLGGSVAQFHHKTHLPSTEEPMESVSVWMTHGRRHSALACLCRLSSSGGCWIPGSHISESICLCDIRTARSGRN